MFKPIGIFLLSLFLYSQVYNTSVWIHYELNIEEITDAFCINTDKPDLNCNGTCHLKKQIIQTDQSNSSESPLVVYLNEIQLFPNTNTNEVQVPAKEIVLHRTEFGVTYSYLQTLSIFHPPQV